MNASSVDRLRRFVNRATDHSSCDLCRSELADQHRHLLELAQRKMLCACDACALLFSDSNGSRFRPIPQTVTRIDLKLSDEEWNGLGIPIGIAFFTVRDHEVDESSSLQASESTQVLHMTSGSPRNDPQAGEVSAPITVSYPSPAGPVMSSVDHDDWKALVAANPELDRLRPEVESLLINRTAGRRVSLIVPLDVCFELIGIVRRHWQGFSGGPDVHREIDRFFDQLEASAENGVPS